MASVFLCYNRYNVSIHYSNMIFNNISSTVTCRTSEMRVHRTGPLWPYGKINFLKNFIFNIGHCINVN